jgi:hypothetical protein
MADMDMSNIPDGEITGSRVKIGAKSNTGKTILWIGGALVAVGAMVTFYKMSGTNDEPKMRALEEFRSSYAQKCNNAEFSAPASAFLKDQFLNSTVLQEAVTKQAAALAQGASCADVEQGLRAASFPLSAHSHT